MGGAVDEVGRVDGGVMCSPICLKRPSADERGFMYLWLLLQRMFSKVQ